MDTRIAYWQLAPVDGRPWPRTYATKEDAERIRSLLTDVRLLGMNKDGKIVMEP